MEKPNVGAAVLAALSAGIAMHTPEIPRMPAAVFASKRTDDDAVLLADHGPHYEQPQFDARPVPLTAPELMSAKRPVYRWWEQEDEYTHVVQSVIARQRSNALLTILS